jgi:hypothetical protein
MEALQQSTQVKQKRKKREFSATKIAGVLFILIVFVILVLPMILWSLQPYHKLNVWILDKTVPTQEYREHQGTMWALNYYRITDKKYRSHSLSIQQRLLWFLSPFFSRILYTRFSACTSQS